MARNGQLVCQQLENISYEALKKYQAIIRAYIKGRNGVYALYRGDKLYYVGLATNLRSRLKAHLRDRHGNAWDRFSVYLTIGDAHLREMESLLLRIAKPSGNRQIGRFARCENLQKRLVADIRTLQQEERDQLVGKLRSVKEKKTSAKSDEKRPVLAIYPSRPTRLKAVYKGKTYRARVRKSGAIRFNGKTYNSPSVAAIAITGRPTNGWWLWQYERGPGNWVRLRELRE